MATEDDVRRIALSLPEVIEKPWYNSPGFRVKDKGFLRIRAEAEGWLVVFVADMEDREALLASDPAKFHTTPHYDGYPIVLVDLDAVDEAEARAVSPARATRAGDGGRRPPRGPPVRWGGPDRRRRNQTSGRDR